MDCISGMNAGIYENFGYTDWRLPNRKELRSLVDYSQYNPAIPEGYLFTNVQSSYYWSSTYNTSGVYSDNAWLINIGDGRVNDDDKSYHIHYVWPVRGGLSRVSTAITLSSFTAIPKNKEVIIQWSTETEIDNAEFNIYRATIEDGEYTKINDSLIPAQGSSTQGARYKYIDSGLKNGKIYYYKLEDVDLNGVTTMHEVAKATPRWIYSFFK